MYEFAIQLFDLNKQQFLKINKIDQNMQSFPQNLPYMQAHAKEQAIVSSQSEGSIPDSQALMARIHDLQRKLVELSALLAEDGGMQEAFYQLQQQNEELRGMLSVHGEGRQSQLEAANQLLKDNLLKQNEDMEQLYRQLQQARHSQSRLQERGHSQLLQSKIQELNDQISNLLVKIQQLVDENNSQQQAISQFQQMQNMLKEYQNKNKEMQVQNQILKSQIRSLQDNYIAQIARLKAQAQEKQNTQRTQLRSNQTKRNIERERQDRAEFQQEIAALRAQLALRSQQDQNYRQNEAQSRRKWEERLAASQEQLSALNTEVNKIRALLRQQENKCSQYQFVLDQQQKDRERLAFYKSSYSDSQTLRNTIVKLQAQKEELLLRTQRLKAELSQRKFELPSIMPLPQKSQMMNFFQGQAEQELQKCKRLNKDLKSSISRYEKDYRQIRQEYEQLLHQKINAVEAITSNQIQLQRHKEIYQQVVARCNATTADYKQLQKKVLILQEQRNVRTNLSNYDKENSHLIQLENSALRQEIASLKEQLSSKQALNVSVYDGEGKRRERQIIQQLQMYRQKYLKQLEKGKKDKEKESNISQLQQKLVRVNRVLNQKMKELQRLQSRQAELQEELNKAYARCKMQFQNFGVRHHPQVKRLQTDLLAAQRQIMESELAFKTQITSCEDQLKACRLQNQHHRAKIDQLLLEVNRERNSLDYSKLARSLELNELTIKDLQRQLQHKDQLLDQMRSQLKKNQNRQRNRAETSLIHKDIHLQREKQNLQAKILQRQNDIQALAQYLNALEPSNRLEDPLKRALKYLSKMASNVNMNGSNERRRKDSVSSRQSSHSRYDELLRKKSLIAQQFKQSQQFLIDQPIIKEQRKEQRVGILRRLQENLSI